MQAADWSLSLWAVGFYLFIIFLIEKGKKGYRVAVGYLSSLKLSSF
jgi:hypothetical protein